MFDTHMTVIGNLVDNPRMRITKNGHAVTNFRIASTSRRWDAEKGGYVDNATLFVNVTCWRAQAENTYQSLKKGHPVVVIGRFYSREYTVDEVRRIAYELEANAVGPDLSRGVAEFRKVNRGPVTAMAADAQGMPADESDRWLGLVPEEPPGDLDRPAADPAAALDPAAATGDALADGARPLVAVG